MKLCRDCQHCIAEQDHFSLCRRTQFTNPETKQTDYIPVLMERMNWAGCCGPDAKFFEERQLEEAKP